MKRFISILAALLCCIFGGTTAHAAMEQPVSYLQYDENWGSKMYSSIGSSSQTIGNSGCGPTSLAMVLSYYTRNNITPDTMADYAVSHGYRTSYEGTSWEIFNTIANEYNLEFMQTSSSSEALDWLQTKSDALIICSMGPGLWTRQGHFIVVWGEQEGEVFINDPASLQENRIRNSYNTMANQCRQFFCYNQNIPEAIIEAPVIEEKTLLEILRERLYLSQPTFNQPPRGVTWVMLMI